MTVLTLYRCRSRVFRKVDHHVPEQTTSPALRSGNCAEVVDGEEVNCFVL